MKDISLGGINKKNIKKLQLIKPYGFAGISFFDKKKAPKKGPFKFIQNND
jgi:thiamine-phosphate pyrophosphorylase